MPRGHTASLKIPKKGQRFGGSQKGTQNKVTRELKEAVILAAELSKHSKTHDLVGYLKFLADSRPETFTTLLGRMLPIQGKMTVEANVNVIKAKPETEMTQDEMIEYWAKLRALPTSTKPLVIVDNDTGEPLYSEVAE